MEWSETDPVVTARGELKEEKEEGGLTATEKLWDLAVTNEYQILDQWLFRYEPGVFLNKAHVFALELLDETRVTLNPEEHDQAQWFDYDDARYWAASWTRLNQKWS